MTGPRKGRKMSASEMQTPPKLVVRARQKPPATLTKAQAAAWRELVNSLPADYFKACDRRLLRLWCVHSAQFDEATDAIALEGLTVTNANGRKVPNPMLYVQSIASASLTNLSIKLRIAPSSRMDDRVAATKVNAEKDAARPWEDGEAAAA
jgi:P27 family predicted phage terminase small subunit